MPFSPDGIVPVTLAHQVAAFLIYLQSDQSPEPFRNGYKQLGQLRDQVYQYGTYQHNSSEESYAHA